MIYMGSKNRIAKHILPIMLAEAEKNNITTWVEPFCLCGSTTVSTPKGLATLKDVEIGGIIYDDNCKPQKVVNKFKSAKTKGLRIELKGNVSITATPEHKFYLTNGSEIEAGSLTVGDSLMTGGSVGMEEKVVDLGDYVTHRKHGAIGSRGGCVEGDKVRLYHNAPRIPRFLKLDSDFCWALGLVIAEGSSGRVTLHRDEMHLAERFISIYENILQVSLSEQKKYYFDAKKNSLSVAVPYPRIFDKIFFEVSGIGYGARNKNLNIGYELSPELFLCLLRGMHSGDGCVRTRSGKYRSWNYKTASNELAKQLQILLSVKLGIKSTLSTCLNKERYIDERLLKESSYCNISVNSISDVLELVGDNLDNSINRELSKGYCVKSITEVDGEFYDITLNSDSDHRFIIQGGIVTHNCGGANMIDKVPESYTRIGYDLNEHTIAAMLGIRDFVDQFPESITEDYYKSLKGTEAHPINSWIRFGGSFGGKFDNGYARSKDSKGNDRNHLNEAKRNALKQSPKIQSVEFICASYKDVKVENSLIYCFDTETELLTDNGWKYVKDIETGDKCLSREPNTKKLDYKDVIRTTQYHHKGEMYSYQSKMVDLLVTPDHNLFVNKKVGRIKERKDIFLKPTNITNYNFQFVSAGGSREGVDNLEYCVQGVVLNAEKFAYLLGLFITDGSVNNQKTVTISQSKQPVIDKIRNTLLELGIPHSEYLSSRGLTTFYIKKPFAKYFEQFYKKSTRRIPKDILSYNKIVLSSLLDGIMDGDGDGRRIYLQSKDLAGDIQELCYKVGKSSLMTKRPPTVRKLKCGREIVGTKDYYAISVNNSEYLDTNSNYGKFVSYDDMVYCVTLSEWHTVLTRRNGKCVWLGQCDPPYQGTTGYKTGAFNHEELFQWCRDMKAKGNIVFVSEYNAPDDFELVWQGEIKTNFSYQRKEATHKAVEKLFKV